MTRDGGARSCREAQKGGAKGGAKPAGGPYGCFLLCVEDGDEKEAGRALTRQPAELMGSEVTEGEEAARARRGPLFTDENFTMGG